jgi:predicted SAM-dependent methyltransferase
MNVYSQLKMFTASREIRHYLKSTPEPKVNIGCGKNLIRGWLNADLYPQFGCTYLNAAAAWPTQEASIAAILCEHMIEHVPKQAARRIAVEAYRALRPGGFLRLVTPDLTTFAQFVLKQLPQHETSDYILALERFKGDGLKITVCDAINEIFYEHGHCYIYTRDELVKLLHEAGFTEFVFMRGGQYRDPLFDGVDGHPKIVGQRMNEIEAIAIEAQKPFA